MTDRKKTGAAFWVTMVVVAVLVAYPLSFGPACWLVDRGIIDTYYAFHGSNPYRPLMWLSVRCPTPVMNGLCDYADLGKPANATGGHSIGTLLLIDEYLSQHPSEYR